MTDKYLMTTFFYKKQDCKRDNAWIQGHNQKKSEAGKLLYIMGPQINDTLEQKYLVSVSLWGGAKYLESGWGKIFW